MKQKKVPRFYGFRIYFLASLIYIFLVFPIVGILFAKYLPDWIEKRETKSTQNDSLTTGPESLIGNIQNNSLKIENLSTEGQLDTLFSDLETKLDSSSILQEDSSHTKIPEPVEEKEREEQKLTKTLNVLFKVLIISFFLGFIFNLPFKIFFRRKRKGKKIPENLFRFCKKYLLLSPWINSLIVAIPFLIALIYMLFRMFIQNSDDITTQRFYQQYFFISLLSALLTVLFVYFWEKHRVHIKYLEHIFSETELRRRIFKIKVGRIRNRLWVSSAMTTLLPLIIVIFYLFLSFTTIKELGLATLTDEQITVLFGKYTAYFGRSVTFTNIESLFYVNIFDSILMFVGIFTGIFISIVYLLFFVTWTTEDIVKPVRDLLDNMQKTGRGELDQFAIVRTNDEVGELTEGYNDMSQKIKDYISNIYRINEANSRFVPKKFLEFLGKDSIADIKLGDQVQHEMSVLFSDIRSFTSISEEMTPKENFNFLNNYLGYMEPVIRNNHGFIDKFMGDSIMALFPDSAEDALNAAIEMRYKLQEFNHIISQFGKPSINSGIGIHTGNLMLGVVGGEGRMDGTVISDAVNLASRLEGLTKIYGGSVIISEDTLIRLGDPGHYNYRFIDIVKVKGKKEAVYIFELLDGEPEETKSLKIQTKTQFGKALQLYKNMQFEEAMKLFSEVFAANNQDLATVEYIQRCKGFIHHGVPEGWDGIEEILEK